MRGLTLKEREKKVQPRDKVLLAKFTTQGSIAECQQKKIKKTIIKIIQLVPVVSKTTLKRRQYAFKAKTL